MSLIYCPECGHEISSSAVACPSCGRPINGVAPAETIVVPPTRKENEGFPPWAVIPIGIAALAFIFFLIYAMSNRDDTADTNLNVNVSARRTASQRDVDRDRDIDPPSSDTSYSSGSVPAAPPDPQVTTVPGSQTSVPPEVTKGRVTIEARVATRTGTPAVVKNEKFYLLDEDLETILSNADLEPISGQSLTNSFGLSVLYPNRYGTFYKDALAAIRKHIKYSGTTNSAGKAELANIEPDGYFLFGITRTGNGFALWSNPVTIQAGDNILNLAPQPVTEMNNTSMNRSSDEFRYSSE